MNTKRTTLIRTMAIVLVISMSIACLTACSQQQKDLQGVNATDSESVAVTFKVPEGLTVEDVLGSKIGGENTMVVGEATFVYWYHVANGGILSRNGAVYRYAPNAEESYVTGVAAPPAYAMLYNVPDSSGIFDPADSGELAERYGIHLYFG